MRSICTTAAVNRQRSYRRRASTNRGPPPRHRSAASVGGRGHADGHQDVGNVDAKLRDIPGRFVVPEELGVLLIEGGEVGRVRQQYSHLDDVSRVAPAARRMCSQFARACAVCCWMVTPASSPVLASTPTMPDT